MDFQVLISTMNPSPDSFKGKNFNVLVISQNQTGIHFQDENLEFISFDEKGLSKSRNRALENGKAELGLIADDDVAFCEDFDAKIKKAFQEFPDADIITFKILTPTGENYKNYPESSFKHTRKSIYTVSSVEIVFKLERLKKAGIKFDERFGLGASYPSGEETIFLNDAMNKGLNIYFVPEYIVMHPLESSGKILDASYYKSKGALIKRLYGYSFNLVLGMAFLIKQYLKPQKSISFFSSFKESLIGFNSINKG